MNLDNEGIDNATIPEVTEIDESEMQSLEPELVEIPEVGEVLVGGNPFEIADTLDDSQGDNALNARGDCGCVSVLNLLRMAGMDYDETDVVVKAVGLRLCTYSTDLDACDNGGTNVLQRQKLLQSYGIQSTIFSGRSLGPEEIAKLVESGHGVNIGVNAGYAWNNPDYVGSGSSNHSIVVTGTARDPETHELLGLFVCDSGADGETSAKFLSVDCLDRAYTNAYGSSALVTNEPIRT